MSKHLKDIVFYILLFMVILFIVSRYDLFNVQQRTYSELCQAIAKEELTTLSLTETKATAFTKDNAKFEVTIPSIYVLYENVGDSITKQIHEGKLEVKTPPPPSAPLWLAALPTVGIVIVAILIWVLFAQQSQGGGGRVMSFGRSRAKMVTDTNKTITFKDVAGADEEKAELEEIVEFLKEPKKFVDLGARIPRGVLLVGPPGTGKTLLAKAVSGEAGVPFFSISGSDFVEMFVGVGASRVRDLFDQAKKAEPSIVFIDEIDAVGRHRGAGMGGGHDEREQTLNQLLVEMDGFGVNQGVIIIAATNRPDILDPALLRPGRFDRQVFVGVPDVKGREQILEVHTKKKPLEETVKLDVIAKTTAGFTGADLENLANEAALLAARKDKKRIDEKDFGEALIKVIAGPEKKSKVITEKERKLTAYHEAGHAIVGRLLPTQDKIHQVSIIPRGRFGGYTMHLPSEDKYYSSKSEMLEDIISLLAGRVAEEIVLEDISTGASNDIERATKAANKMVTKYGMSSLGTIAFSSEGDEVFLGRDYGHSRNYSEDVAAKIDLEIKAIIDECYARCTELIKTNRDKLDLVANRLLEVERIEADEFEELFSGKKPPKKTKKEVAE